MIENSIDKALFLETIQQMAVISEHALPNVRMHIQRVRKYAYIIARGLKLSDAEAETISIACQLHDVGMVSVPVSIVMKTTNLDNEEWNLIRKHPEVGASLLKGLPHDVFRLAETVAVTHHERWDGSGYPFGLKGDEIPVAGRICGLCDVFDTLTHPRAYKRALSPDEVLLLLQESSESFFDPDLIDVFTLHYPEIFEIWEQLKNELEDQPAFK